MAEVYVFSNKKREIIIMVGISCTRKKHVCFCFGLCRFLNKKKKRIKLENKNIKQTMN